MWVYGFLINKDCWDWKGVLGNVVLLSWWTDLLIWVPSYPYEKQG